MSERQNIPRELWQKWTSPQPVAEVLMRGRAYLESPEHWVQYQSRKTSGMLWWRNTAYCASGWVEANAGVQRDHAMTLLCWAARELFPESSGNVVYVNDKLGHAATLQMFDRAIQMALNKGV